MFVGNSPLTMDQVSKSRDTLLRSRASAVDLQHLRYAVAAADHGSFRRAAEVLLLQQSTLSRCIPQLEHVGGMTLFERSSGGGLANEAGRRFLRPAPAMLEGAQSLVQMVHPTRRLAG